MFKYIFDSFGESSTLYDKKCDKFRLISIARTQFGEVHIFTEELFFQFLDISYFSNSNNGEAPEMRIDNDRLCICVANNADSSISFEFVQFSFKFGSKISTFQIMNRTDKTFLLTISSESAPLRSQM